MITLNCGDIVFQAWSGRLGIIIESRANPDGLDATQQHFDWHAKVSWFTNKVKNDYPLGIEYALTNSLNLISKA
tara:strand:+ start:5440 stop:5661 length:222 start_codon:yes stop_codon:yes gene_type:complete